MIQPGDQICRHGHLVAGSNAEKYRKGESFKYRCRICHTMSRRESARNVSRKKIRPIPPRVVRLSEENPHLECAKHNLVNTITVRRAGDPTNYCTKHNEFFRVEGQDD